MFVYTHCHWGCGVLIATPVVGGECSDVDYMAPVAYASLSNCVCVHARVFA